MKKIGFLDEKEGIRSSIRLFSLLTFLLLCGIDYWILEYSYYSNKPYDQLFVILFLLVNLIFLVATFYPKYLQKIIELGGAKINEFKEALKPIKPEDLKPKE